VVAQKAKALSLMQLRDAYTYAGTEEKRLMRDLVEAEVKEEAFFVAEFLHYFPGATLVREVTTSDHSDRKRVSRRYAKKSGRRKGSGG